MRLFLFQPKTCWHLVSLKKKKKNSIPPLENLRFIPISKCLHLKSVLLTYFRVLDIHRYFWCSIMEFTKNIYVYCSRNGNFYLILDPKYRNLNLGPIFMQMGISKTLTALGISDPKWRNLNLGPILCKWVFQIFDSISILGISDPKWRKLNLGPILCKWVFHKLWHD